MAIPTSTISHQHIGNTMEDIRASMRADDFPHIANLLNDLYSNKVRAITREYSTNALDSHIDAGQVRPIEVTLPTSDRLQFVVQDWGLGLSVDDLRDTYSLYGRSTKRGSNLVTGMLGLGCKSALAYTEAFTIEAVKDGIKTVAMSTKDEQGVGVIKVLDTAGTDEPNGVKITIPVDRWDVSKFADEAQFLFSFWDEGTVLINGEPPQVPEWRKRALPLDDYTYVVPGSVSGLYSSYVVVGNVPYPIPDIEDEKWRKTRRVVAFLNHGDIEFVPSREAVKHTVRTDTTLAELGEYVRDNFRRVLETSLASTKTRWEETLLKVQWKGSQVSLTAGAGESIWSYRPNVLVRKATRTSRYSLSNLTNTTSTAVITGFKAQTVSNLARERMVKFFPDATFFVILPEGTNGVNQLDGRPNVVRWADVLGATEVDPVTKAKVKRPKVETVYSVYNGPDMTAAELAELKEVYYLHSDEFYDFDGFGLPVVRLRASTQEARLRRLVPQIKHFRDEVARRTRLAAEAVTDEDRAQVRANYLHGGLACLDPDKIDDPELAKWIRLRNAPQSTTLTEAYRFGIVVGDRLSDSAAMEKISDRYPLITNTYYSQVNHDDSLIYVNAKYAAMQAEGEGDEAEDEA